VGTGSCSLIPWPRLEVLFKTLGGACFERGGVEVTKGSGGVKKHEHKKANFNHSARRKGPHRPHKEA